jgi:hypothetical protein
MGTPSEALLAATQGEEVVRDALGRRLALRRLGALDKLRLFEAAGPVLSGNDRWLGMAVLACSVTAIDDVPWPMPASKQGVEAMVQRLGDDGIAAVSRVLASGDEDAEPAMAGN